MSLVAGEWEQLCDENREMKEQMKELRKKVTHYEQLEDSLHETLQNVRSSAENRMEGAQRQADHIVEKAHRQAADIVHRAEQQRGKVHGDIMGLLGKRAEIAGSIRAYLQATIDSLEQFEDDPANRFRAPQFPPDRANPSSSRDIDALVDELE